MTWKEWILIVLSPIITYWVLLLSCDFLLKVISLMNQIFQEVEGNLRFIVAFTLFTGIYLRVAIGIIQEYGFLIGINLLMYVLMLFYLLNKPKGTIGLVPKGAIKEFWFIIRYLGTGIYIKYLKKK